MIDRRSDDRQTDRDVNRGFEIEEFHGRVALIVVHTNHRVVSIMVYRLVKNRISGVGAGYVNSRIKGFRNRRSYEFLFFVPKKPIFAGMWIKSANRDAWILGTLRQGSVR
tara:strand:+ start:593 stop:922 length:330 start_codon:yes stop_codon:yes gene_type:complete